MTYISENGYFGEFGGSFIPEILHDNFQRLISAFNSVRDDKDFWDEFKYYMKNYSSRPTPLTFAENLTKHFAGPKIYIKREDFNFTGSHKFNNVLGQAMIAKRLGKTRLIAETGAGQHGIATATIAAKFGFECTIYMGEKDVKRQRPNVFWMEKLGAKVVPVTNGSRSLKDAVNEAFKDWVTNPKDTHYTFGTACGPYPFPELVASFQSIIGEETIQQILEIEKKMPQAVYACVGGGSNALGIFSAFIGKKGVDLVGVEAGGLSDKSGNHASRLAISEATVAVAQGYKSFFLQSQDGQMNDTHSVAAGLDYVGVSPILVDLWSKGAARFISATDAEVMEAHALIVSKEGIIPALESTHAVAGAFKEISKYSKNDSIIINLSGRGDKDIFTIAEAYNDSKWKEFIKEKYFEYFK